ncbi:MAG TPA: carbamoyltransferase HypF [Candidatus Binatia bacterium]|nr:carbamoyltransferase HypF [Candidatus Binatia bacterium]
MPGRYETARQGQTTSVGTPVTAETTASETDCTSIAVARPTGIAVPTPRHVLGRRSIFVRGIVQGVGFRPFVFALAGRLGVSGFVRNCIDGVLIEVEGEAAAVASFEDLVVSDCPSLARIERMETETLAARGSREFVIADSEGCDRSGERHYSADVATCDACLEELSARGDRRYGYPFLNCAHCGPRFTILCRPPYDRPNTTMAGFPMCGDCRSEYDDPYARRFHAQAIACPACGPRLVAHDSEGRPLSSSPISWCRQLLLSGSVVAVKGLGGFHLACDATSETATQRLRARKHRDDKAFAVMVADLEAARRSCHVSADEAELLSSPRRPIVLLRRRDGSGIAAAVAPGNPLLGLMLPYTPLHTLLMQEAGRPLVLTSANLCDEPIAYQDLDARRRLRGIADGFLSHDRPIRVRCDDSVARIVRGRPSILRRSRGHAPEPVFLPMSCPRPILALGGHLKNTFAMARSRTVVLSHHLGDLGDWSAFRAFRESVAHYEALFDFEPQLLVRDLHPDYATTRYALERKSRSPDLHIVAVQHHHAHMASCMAENGLAGPVIAVAFDGTGYGSDGTLWGGEFLVGDYRGFRRAAHMRPVRLAGGDQAARQPWRVAVAHLMDCGQEPERQFADLPGQLLGNVRTMIRTGMHSPVTSSVGRLFDAAAALLRVRREVTYEGQAAMELEWLAAAADDEAAFPFGISGDDGAIVVDTRPLFRAMMQGVSNDIPKAQLARRFHTTLADVIASVVARLRHQTGIEDVVLTGGVFQNVLLLEMAERRLEMTGVRVHTHRRVPANDGGLSLGQLAVAAAVLGEIA